MVADRTTDKSLESSIWNAAYSIRGGGGGPELPLVFTKRISELGTEAEVADVEEEDVKQRSEASNPSVAIHVRILDHRSSQ